MANAGERVLVIGGGGREHALAWALSASEHVAHVYVSPGNAGTCSKTNISNISKLFEHQCRILRVCEFFSRFGFERSFRHC